MKSENEIKKELAELTDKRDAIKAQFDNEKNSSRETRLAYLTDRLIELDSRIDTLIWVLEVF